MYLELERRDGIYAGHQRYERISKVEESLSEGGSSQNTKLGNQDQTCSPVLRRSCCKSTRPIRESPLRGRPASKIQGDDFR
jgi:hypothetical protein